MLQTLLSEGAEAVMAAGAGWLLTYLLHSTLLIAAAWLLDRWLSAGRRPRLRSWLWTAAMLGGVATATASSLGVSPSLFELRVTEAEKAVLEQSMDAGRSGWTAGADGDVAGAGAVPTTGEPSTRFVSPQRRELSSPAAWLSAIGHDWPFLLFLVSTAAAAVLLVRRAAQLLGQLGRLRDRSRVESGPLRRALEELTGEDGEAHDVVLSRSAALASPVTLPGGEICVPDRVAEDLDDREVKALLAHELAHLRRGDPVTLLALAALEAALAVQPLNRVARRRLVAAAERRVDDRVRSRGLGPELASTLVTVGRRVRGRRPGRPLAGLARESGLELRVRRLLDGSGSRGAGRGAGVAAAVAALVVPCLLALAAPGVRIAASPHPPLLLHGSGEPSRPPSYCASPLPGVPVRGGGDCDAEAGPRPETRDRLSAGPGVGLYVEIDAAEQPLRLRLRPGNRFVRLYDTRGRQLVLPMPPPGEGPDGGVATLRFRAAAGEGHLLYVPPSVRRLTVVVDGRVVTSRDLSAGDGLPRLLGPSGAG